MVLEEEDKKDLSMAVVKEEQDALIHNMSSSYIQESNLSGEEKAEMEKVVNQKLSLDIDSLYEVGTAAKEKNKDITGNELTLLLLKEVSINHKSKVIRKAAKRLMRKRDFK